MIFNRRSKPQHETLGIWDDTKRQDYSKYLDKYGVAPTLAEYNSTQPKQKTDRGFFGRKNPATANDDLTASQSGPKPRKRKVWGLPLVAGSVVTFLLLQLVVTLVLFFGYTVNWVAQRIQSTDAYAIQTAATNLLGDATAVNKLLNDFITWLETTPAALYTVQAFLYLPWLLFMVYATYRRGLRSFAKEFWLKFKRYDLLWGLLIGIGLLLAVNLVQWLLSLIPGVDLTGSDNGAALFQTQGIWLYVTAFGIGGIVGPFFEELYFRGFVMQGFIRAFGGKPGGAAANTPPTAGFRFFLYRYRNALAVISTAVFFGCMHLQIPTNGSAWTLGYILVPIVTGSLGLVLGYIAVRTRRLGINIFAHMAYNSLSVAVAFLFGGS